MRAGIEGYYVLDDPKIYGAKTMQEVPVGQVLHLAIKADKWLLRNFLSGWEGTLKKTAKGAILTTLESPSGKVAKPKKSVAVITDLGLELTSQEKGGPIQRFKYLGRAIPDGFFGEATK